MKRLKTNRQDARYDYNVRKYGVDYAEFRFSLEKEEQYFMNVAQEKRWQEYLASKQ